MKDVLEYMAEFFVVSMAAIFGLVGAVIAIVLFVKAALWTLGIKTPSFEQRCLELGKELGTESKYYRADCYIKNPTGWTKI